MQICGAKSLKRMQMGDEDAVVTTVFHAAAEIEMIRSSRLHPFGGDDDTLRFRKLCAAEVSKTCAAYGHGDLLRVADDTKLLCVDFRDEERRTMAEDVVVEACAACINKVKLAAQRQPMLLRVVTAERRSVIEQPFDWLVEMEAVL